jgi:hypothetical protein
MYGVPERCEFRHSDLNIEPVPSILKSHFCVVGLSCGSSDNPSVEQCEQA